MRQTSSQYVEIPDEPLTGSFVSLAEGVNEVMQERMENLRKDCSSLNRFKSDSKMRQTSSQYVEIPDEPLTGSLVSLAEGINEVMQERAENLRKDIEFVKTIRKSPRYQLLAKESDPQWAEVNKNLNKRVEKIQIEIASLCKVVEDLRSQVKTQSSKSKTNNTFLPSVAV